MRFATPEEIAHWNDHILSNPDGGNMFQGYELSEQKKLGGWRPRYIIGDDIAITAHEKMVLGLGKLWYLPKGPGVTSVRQLDDLLPGLKKLAWKSGVFLMKVEPELLKQPETLSDLMKLGLIKARPIQPNFSTILVDISGDPDAILAHLNQKGRHAIRRAERDGVTVRRVAANEDNCYTMYTLLAATAKGSFRIRTYAYHRTFWRRYEKTGLGQMFFAYVDGQVVAAAYAIAFGEKGTYKDGASVRERTVYGASHLLQWHVILWMKEKGVTIHDLCGAPPSEEINNPDHPHYGIGRFKTSFNKHVTDYIGTYDCVIKPTQYKLWKKIGERVTLRLYSVLNHESYY